MTGQALDVGPTEVCPSAKKLNYLLKCNQITMMPIGITLVKI